MLKHFIKKIFGLLFAIGCLEVYSSCSSNVLPGLSIIEYTPTGNVKVFDFKDTDFYGIVGTEQAEYKYSDIYSKVEYVKLEATEKSTLGNIQKMEVLPNGDFIVFDYKRKILARFDSTGHFLNLIGSIGKAHNEYISISDFAYDRFNDEIAIVDPYARALKFYNFEGEFVHDIKFQKIFNTFGIIDKDLIVVCYSHLDRPKDEDIAYNLIVYDRNGNPVAKYDPYSMDDGTFCYDIGETFKYHNGQLIGNLPMLPTFFTFKKEKLVPLYYLDFGERQFPVEKYKTISVEDYMRSDRSQYALCRKFYETDKKYIMLISNQGRTFLYMQDKKDSSNVFLKNLAFNDLKGKIDIPIFDHFQGNKSYIFFDPSLVDAEYDIFKRYKTTFEENHGTVTPEDIEIMEDLSKHNNPVIQICTLKDGF